MIWLALLVVVGGGLLIWWGNTADTGAILTLGSVVLAGGLGWVMWLGIDQNWPLPGRIVVGTLLVLAILWAGVAVRARWLETHVSGRAAAGLRVAADGLRVSTLTDLDRLTALLDHPVGATRMQAIQALAQIPGNDAVRAIASLAAREADATVRQAACHALIVRLPTDDREEVAAGIRSVLDSWWRRGVGWHDVAYELTRLLLAAGDPGRAFLAHAVTADLAWSRALVLSHDVQCVVLPLAEPWLETGSVDRRREVAEGLGQIGWWPADPRLAAAMDLLLGDIDGVIRRGAASDPVIIDHLRLADRRTLADAVAAAIAIGGDLLDQADPVRLGRALDLLCVHQDPAKRALGQAELRRRDPDRAAFLDTPAGLRSLAASLTVAEVDVDLYHQTPRLPGRTHDLLDQADAEHRLGYGHERAARLLYERALDEDRLHPLDIGYCQAQIARLLTTNSGVLSPTALLGVLGVLTAPAQLGVTVEMAGLALHHDPYPGGGRSGDLFTREVAYELTEIDEAAVAIRGGYQFPILRRRVLKEIALDLRSRPLGNPFRNGSLLEVYETTEAQALLWYDAVTAWTRTHHWRSKVAEVLLVRLDPEPSHRGAVVVELGLLEGHHLPNPYHGSLFLGEVTLPKPATGMTPAIIESLRNRSAAVVDWAVLAPKGDTYAEFRARAELNDVPMAYPPLPIATT